MLDFTISKEELIEMFINGQIKDANDGWIYEDSMYIDIIAIHEQDPKFIYDITDADYYKIIALDKK